MSNYYYKILDEIIVSNNLFHLLENQDISNKIQEKNKENKREKLIRILDKLEITDFYEIVKSELLRRKLINWSKYRKNGTHILKSTDLSPLLIIFKLKPYSLINGNFGDQIFSSGLFEILVPLIKSNIGDESINTLKLLDSIMMIVRNESSINRIRIRIFIQLKGIEILVSLLKSIIDNKDEKRFNYLENIFGFITNMMVYDTCQDLIVSQGIIPYLIPLILSENFKVSKSVIRLLRQISKHTNYHQILVETDCFSSVVKLFNSLTDFDNDTNSLDNDINSLDSFEDEKLSEDRFLQLINLKDLIDNLLKLDIKSKNNISRLKFIELGFVEKIVKLLSKYSPEDFYSSIENDSPDYMFIEDVEYLLHLLYYFSWNDDISKNYCNKLQILNILQELFIHVIDDKNNDNQICFPNLPLIINNLS